MTVGRMERSAARAVVAATLLLPGCAGDPEPLVTDSGADSSISFDASGEDAGETGPRFEDAAEDPADVPADTVDADDPDAPADADMEPDLRAGVLIGPEGGVADFGFARAIVPVGALDESVRIELVVDGVELSDLPPQFSAISPVVGFLPLDLEFLIPVEVSIAFEGSVSRTDVWWLTADDRWRPLDTEVSGRWSSAEVLRFGEGFVGRPTGPYCGDGAAEGEEACDGAEMLGAACEDIGFINGPPICTDGCSIDYSTCDDPCEGLSCDAPPEASCRGANILNYSLPGECVAGECVWAESTEECEAFTSCLLGECVASPGPGDLVITEFLADPAGTDEMAEWFEIENTSGRRLYVGGLLFSDEGSDRFALPLGVWIEPDTRIVLSSSAEAVSGSHVDWSPYGRFSLSNSADEIVIEFDSVEIDRVEWSSGWTLPEARSTSLSDRAVDDELNDDPLRWCASVELYGDGGNTGTPGAGNGICPFCGDGFVDPPEQCDDGGTEPDDGCDPYCFVE